MESTGIFYCLGATLLVLPNAPAIAGDAGWVTASDVGRDVLVVAALGAPVVKGDWSGLAEAGGSMALAGGTTLVLKQLVDERRPDGSDNNSFPSGHTSISFAAAATLENRYGWEVGAPAFAIASFVGVARVEARKHYWYDVVAGAALGTGSGFLLTNKLNDRVRLVPWGDHSGGGVTVAVRF